MEIVVHALGTDIAREMAAAGLDDAGTDICSFLATDAGHVSKDWRTHWILFDLGNDEEHGRARELWHYCYEARIRSCFVWFSKEEDAEETALRAAVFLSQIVRSEEDLHASDPSFIPNILHCRDRATFSEVLRDLSEPGGIMRYELDIFTNRALRWREHFGNLSSESLVTPLDRLWHEADKIGAIPIAFRRRDVVPGASAWSSGGTAFTAEMISAQVICAELRTMSGSNSEDRVDQLLQSFDATAPIVPYGALTAILQSWFAKRLMKWFLGEDPWSWYAEPLESLSPPRLGQPDLTSWFIQSLEIATVRSILNDDHELLRWFIKLLDQRHDLVTASGEFLSSLIRQDVASARLDQGIQSLRNSHESWRFIRRSDDPIKMYEGSVHSAIAGADTTIRATFNPSNRFIM